MHTMSSKSSHNAQNWSAARVKALREKAGMSRAQFAAVLNIHVSTLSRLEDGVSTVTAPRARELAVIDRLLDAISAERVD